MTNYETLQLLYFVWFVNAVLRSGLQCFQIKIIHHTF